MLVTGVSTRVIAYIAGPMGCTLKPVIRLPVWVQRANARGYFNNLTEPPLGNSVIEVGFAAPFSSK